MFQTIVWATDGSESADRALEIAKALGSQEGSVLLVVHSVEVVSGPGARALFRRTRTRTSARRR